MARKNYSKLSMPIRSSAASIYQAFVEPRMLSKFWLKRSSGPLQPGVAVEWEFLVPGARETTVGVKLRPGELIIFLWSDSTRVKIELEAVSRNATVVRISAGPFASTARAVDAAEGFCIVLCDLKILLETGRSPRLVKDKAALIAG